MLDNHLVLVLVLASTVDWDGGIKGSNTAGFGVGNGAGIATASVVGGDGDSSVII